MADIVSRKQAKSEGLKRYFTGQPCKSAHVAERFVSDKGCTACKKQWQKTNRVQVNAYLREWKKDNASYTAKRRAWEARNRDRLVARKRERRAANIEAEREYQRQWSKANPDTARAKNAARRAKIEQAPGHHTSSDVKRILMRQGKRCAYCKSSLQTDYHVDHITPLSKGGGNNPANLQCLCPSCNLHKSDKPSEEYARSIGLLL